jgi:hypothetical protein
MLAGLQLLYYKIFAILHPGLHMKRDEGKERKGFRATIRAME